MARDDWTGGLVEGHKAQFTDSLEDIGSYMPYFDIVNELLALDDNDRAERQRIMSGSPIRELKEISRLNRAQLSNLKLRIESNLSTSTIN